ncbi:MAG: dihydrolipoamide acetyltransferase family protein [Conexivisphaerales archaeon]
MALQFRLPDIGEGVSEGEIVKVLVSIGQEVRVDQPLVEVMTDKVNVQIPSPYAGKVVNVLVKEGDRVKVGDVLIEIEGDSSQLAVSQSVQPEKREEAKETAPTVTASVSSQAAEKTVRAESVLATPAVRKLAKELGVDLAMVRGSGPGGRVTEADVKQFRTAQGAREELIPLRWVRRMIAEHMVKARESTVPVTHVDEVDVTELVSLREAFKGSAEKRGVKLTYLPFIIKALIPALKEFPFMNASVDEENIVLKKYYNIGIATDTEQGLVVPVIKDADRKDIYQLAAEIEELSAKARAGKLALDEVKGGTFSITNVGSIGGLFATPVINYPEVAILGLHKIAKRPAVRNGMVEIRDMTYLSLTFDHRIIDGAYAARFLARVIDILQDSKKLLAEVL